MLSVNLKVAGKTVNFRGVISIDVNPKLIWIFFNNDCGYIKNAKIESVYSDNLGIKYNKKEDMKRLKMLRGDTINKATM